MRSIWRVTLICDGDVPVNSQDFAARLGGETLTEELRDGRAYTTIIEDVVNAEEQEEHAND